MRFITYLVKLLGTKGGGDYENYWLNRGGSIGACFYIFPDSEYLSIWTGGKSRWRREWKNQDL